MSGEMDTPRGGGQTPGGPCQFGLCDGSGFLLDEETNTTSDCRCRAGRIARRRTAGLEGRVPKHYRGVSFDRPPVPEIARVAPEVVHEVRRYVRDIDKNLDAGRGLWIDGRRRHGQDDARDDRLEGRTRGRAARSRSTRCRGC